MSAPPRVGLGGTQISARAAHLARHERPHRRCRRARLVSRLGGVSAPASHTHTHAHTAREHEHGRSCLGALRAVATFAPFIYLYLISLHVN
jgi:hypothetical protein